MVRLLKSVVSVCDPASWGDYRHDFQWAVVAPYIGKIAWRRAETNARIIWPLQHRRTTFDGHVYFVNEPKQEQDAAVKQFNLEAETLRNKLIHMGMLSIADGSRIWNLAGNVGWATVNERQKHLFKRTDYVQDWKRFLDGIADVRHTWKADSSTGTGRGG